MSDTKAIECEFNLLMDRIRQHVGTMPAAEFATNPSWVEAQWSATTFQWHPTSEAPPLMGLVFENEEAGLEIFRQVEDKMNHEDQFDEIRIAIIEGAVPGQEERPGYSVHISADLEALEAHATMDEFVVDQSIVPFLGQWNRHYPVPGTPSLLGRFKQEFETHQEFMPGATAGLSSSANLTGCLDIRWGRVPLPCRQCERATGVQALFVAATSCDVNSSSARLTQPALSRWCLVAVL